MPSKKQRRRRQKSLRHEWEYVYVDEDGQEREVDPAEMKIEKATKERPKHASGKQPARSGSRAGRQIEPPSWRRVGRRALLIAPLFIVAMLLLDRKSSVASRIAPAILLMVFFIPFSYFTDSLAYRMYRKRLDRPAKPKAKPKTR